MYYGAIPHDRIIEAFRLHVPDCYVRDYRSLGGFITICRWYRDIKWRDQLSTANVYRSIPAVTLVNMPQGGVGAPTMYNGLRLVRPGWRLEFRRAMRHLTLKQMRAITRTLGVGEVFPGIV